jgi:hypothetical protein
VTSTRMVINLCSESSGEDAFRRQKDRRKPLQVLVATPTFQQRINGQVETHPYQSALILPDLCADLGNSEKNFTASHHSIGGQCPRRFCCISARSSNSLSKRRVIQRFSEARVLHSSARPSAPGLPALTQSVGGACLAAPGNWPAGPCSHR